MSFFAQARAENPPLRVNALALRDSPPGFSPVARFHCVRYANRFARNKTSGFLPLSMRAWGVLIEIARPRYSGSAWLSIRGGGGDSVLAIPAFTAD